MSDSISFKAVKMVIPPTYGDIGKSAKDLLTKGFNHGQVRIDWKNKLKPDAELNVNGIHTNDTGKLTGSTEMKWSKNGCGAVLKWTTDNRLTAESTAEDKLANGLKVKFEGSFEPHSADKSAKAEVEYKRESLRFVTDAKFVGLRPVVHDALTLAFRQFRLGGEFSYDTAKLALKGTGLAGSYEAHGVVLAAAISDLKNVNASIYHRVSPRLETAASLDWAVGQPQTRISFGNKLQLASGATIKSVVNSAGVIGLAYTQNLTDGVKATLSSEFDAKQFGVAGKHRFGLTLEFEANAMRF